MHTIKVIAAGFVLLAACSVAGRLFGERGSAYFPRRIPHPGRGRAIHLVEVFVWLSSA
jgi:hypothetical protein